MKKSTKIITIFVMLALVLAVTFALASCGEDKTYTYSGAESDSDYLVSVSTLYDSMYKGSKITVNDKRIIWKIADAKETLSVKRDGEKYLLGGEYLKQMNESLGGLETEMYGIETKDGFDLIISSLGLKITLHFSK